MKLNVKVSEVSDTKNTTWT